MGRGDGSQQKALGGASPRRGMRLLGGSGHAAQIGEQATRNLAQRTFIDDIEEWKRQEQEFIDDVLEKLRGATREYAGSDEGWRTYLSSFSQVPEYSLTNNIWARYQFLAKGVEEEGLFLSESAWQALGRRVKSEYVRPDGKRDKRFGYRQDEWENYNELRKAARQAERDGAENADELASQAAAAYPRFDDTYAAELMAPLGFKRFPRRELDAQGNPVIDPETGEPKVRWINGTPTGFKAFVAYHEAATEGLDGGEPPPLPEAPWANATGSEEDARQLLHDLEEVCKREKIELKFEQRGSGDLADHELWRGNHASLAARQHSRYDERSRTITVDSSQPPAEQAASALLRVCEAVSERPPRNEADEQIARAAAESAKYVLASLYGLDANDQTFPHLAEIADSEHGLERLSGDIHQRVKKVMGHLDPRMRAKARAQSEYRAEHPPRATKRRSQRSSGPKSGKQAIRL